VTLREKALRAKLKAAKSEFKIRLRTYNAAKRGLDKTFRNIIFLENRLAKLKLAQHQQHS
jgi:hypothetical protein